MTDNRASAGPRLGNIHDVQRFWDDEACGERDGALQEERRYAKEPEIFDFASFESARGLDVLEIGVGMGADFIRWLFAGARPIGIDLTHRAVRITADRIRERMDIEQPPLAVADCEHLPFADRSFDVVYSWGVLHHTPDTSAGIAEAIRVLRPGGAFKAMLYHRRSWFALAAWIRFGLLQGRPWRSASAAISYVESPGTKAFTRDEVASMLEGLVDVKVTPQLTHWDRRLFPGIAWLLGDRLGWHLLVEAERPEMAWAKELCSE